MQPVPLKEASNKQFQREKEVTQQMVISCVEVKAWKWIYINKLFINSQIHYNLVVIFVCNVFCIYKKLLQKINIMSEGFSIRHETYSNVKS